jgi:nucleotide-binding universal stress UspA family protein
MDIKSILVGVDFSQGSRSALRYATGLARRFEARLVLIHVIDDHDLRLISSATGEEEAKLLRRLRHEAGQRLAEFAAAEGGAGVEAESLVSSGLPYHQIALKARELAADLIVVGGQGMSRDRMPEMFFGSTAEKVVRLLPCPVLCVPALAKE